MSLFFLAFSLLACDDPSIPSPTSAARQLDAGQWEVQVLNASASRGCDLRPQDLVGEALYGDLAVHGDQLVFNLEGARLVGEMHGHSLYVEGSLPSGEHPDRPPIVDHSEPGEDDTDVDSGAPDAGDPDAGDTGAAEPPSGGGSSGSGGGSTRGFHGGGHTEPSRDAGYASIDAEILSRRLANGMMSVSMGRCALDLKVVLAYVGDDRGVVVGTEEDTDTEPPSDASNAPANSSDGG